MNTQDYLPSLISSKTAIIRDWISNKKVIETLNKHNISIEYFVKNYGFGVFDHFVAILKNETPTGDCPVIENMLGFFKEQNIATDSLYVICSGFKNALLHFTFTNNLNTWDIQQHLIDTFEANFEGVLAKYTQTIQDVSSSLKISNHLIDENIIMSTTDIHGIITSASSAFEHISGYSKGELIGSSHSILRHSDMPKELFEDMWRTLSSNNTWHGEIKNKKKDGGFYWVEATISPEFDKSGNKIGYSAIRHDITYKKEVATQQDIIVEQSKATAMGEMISMIAHQWRQPLQAIAILIQKLSLEKLIDGAISDETLDNVVYSIDQQLAYMSKTIEDFRSFFSPTKDKNKIYASALVEQARDFLAYTFKVDEIKFHVHANEDIQINVHTNEILQVFINILNNAREALVEKRQSDRKININYYRSNSNIIFEINDNAGGIPSIIINKIFEPYFSTKKNKNGTGLGLYMSKTIVEKNGHGILGVQNTNEGASFKIVLPIE
ncbi:MAG: PAS domain S-box protein [Campylobacterales bacterium]|nr:PAS domain S-box protein [Campylobacterales bacterium]